MLKEYYLQRYAFLLKNENKSFFEIFLLLNNLKKTC